MATAVSKEKNRLTFVACGLIPGCEGLLEKIGKEPYCIIRRQNEEQVQKTLKFLSSVNKTDKHVQKFLRLYPAWVEYREMCIKEIRDLADNIDFHHRNTNIAQVPTSVIGIRRSSHYYRFSVNTCHIWSISWPHHSWSYCGRRGCSGWCCQRRY